MKTTDFIKESIGQDADNMHRDHEVQMARSDCYTAAKYAIELHKMLHHVAEQQGLDGWVSEKITLANDYLRTVWEYLSHEMAMDEQPEMPVFSFESAEQEFENLLNEGDQERDTEAEKEANETVKESMSAGGTGVGAIATVVSGTGRPTTGKPKKVANTVKSAKPKFGKGIY